MKVNLGPSKLIWHHTNKQMAFEFMADDVVLTHDTEMHQMHLDPFLLQQVLGREPKPGEMVLEFQHTAAMMLECSFLNPAYGEQVSKRFVRRLVKNWGPKRMLLVPNYGMAPKREHILFHRAFPRRVVPQKFIFHLLPTDDMGERVRRGL